MARRAAARVSEADAVVRVAQLRVVCGRRASVAEQRAIAATVALEVTGLPLPEARRHIRPRQWVRRDALVDIEPETTTAFRADLARSKRSTADISCGSWGAPSGSLDLPPTGRHLSMKEGR